MSAQSEEDDRIDALIADADWCHECGVPIGVGHCGGCIAVASLDLYVPDGYFVREDLDGMRLVRKELPKGET